MRRSIAMLLTLATVVVACGGPAADTTSIDDLPPINDSQFLALIGSADRPMVVNVWASWCVPCRSEAALFASAHAEFGNRVRFIGIDVEDTQKGAKSFLEEFGLTFEQYFDPDRRIPSTLGGVGVPITYFVAAGGTVIATHLGIIDERTLALQIDELLNA